MNRRTPKLAAIPFVLLVTACGSSPPVRYFTLDTIEAAYPGDRTGAPVLAMGPLQLPDYLDRSQMVSRGDGTEIVVHDLHRWAEPLGDGLHRTLARNVDGLTDSLIVVAYPANALADADYRLVGRIDRFEVDRHGLAVLELQWGVIDADGKAVLPARRDRYTKQAADRDDPDAIAAALSDTLGQLSREIVTAVPMEEDAGAGGQP